MSDLGQCFFNVFALSATVLKVRKGPLPKDEPPKDGPGETEQGCEEPPLLSSTDSKLLTKEYVFLNAGHTSATVRVTPIIPKVKTMIRLIAVTLLMLPAVALSEIYLCLPDKGAVVTHSIAGAVSSQIANVTNRQYILTNESGLWQVKGVPSGEVVFYLCDEIGMTCRKSETGIDYFHHAPLDRESGGVFVVHDTIFKFDGKGKNRENIRIMKLTESGTCTKIN